jgi:DNA-binding CsgD family transcriptional regulator
MNAQPQRGPEPRRMRLRSLEVRLSLPTDHPAAGEAGELVRHLVEELVSRLDGVATLANVATDTDSGEVAVRAAVSSRPLGRKPRLTPRQLEVLRLLEQGLLTKQIARRLRLSPLTVNNHIHAVLAAFDAPNRGVAVHEARRLNLI